jgi:hypothetical protein
MKPVANERSRRARSTVIDPNRLTSLSTNRFLFRQPQLGHKVYAGLVRQRASRLVGLAHPSFSRPDTEAVANLTSWLTHHTVRTFPMAHVHLASVTKLRQGYREMTLLGK